MISIACVKDALKNSAALFVLFDCTSGEVQSFLCMKKENTMETRVAVMGIVVENTDSVEALNALLHEHGKYIIGRMGLPYREKNIHIVSIAIDAPQDVLSALAGKIGNLNGISIKTAYSNVITHV